MVNGNPARKENHFRGIVVAHRSVNYLSTQEPVCEPFVLYSEIQFNRNQVRTIVMFSGLNLAICYMDFPF